MVSKIQAVAPVSASLAAKPGVAAPYGVDHGARCVDHQSGLREMDVVLALRGDHVLRAGHEGSQVVLDA